MGHANSSHQPAAFHGHSYSLAAFHGHASSSHQSAAIWQLSQKGDAASLRAAILKLPPELMYSYLEFTSQHDHSTPLTIAIQQKNVDCVKLLLIAGVDANRMNFEGSSPLHLAVETNNPTITQLLVEYGTVDCNLIDQRGCTPLLAAAKEGHAQVLDVLLHCGAVEIFACDADSRKDVLAITRKAYRNASTNGHPKFKACLDLISTRLLVRSGCLYECVDSGTGAGWSWTKRNYVILRTANPMIVKIDLFPESEPLVHPSMEMTYHCSHMIQQAAALDLDTAPASLSGRRFRFSLCVCVHGAAKTIDLAAENEDELRTWKDLPIQLRMAQLVAFNATRTRQSFSHREPHPEERLLDEQVALRRQQRREEEEEAQRLKQVRQDELAARQLQARLDREKRISLQRQQRDMELAIQLSLVTSRPSASPTSSLDEVHVDATLQNGEGDAKECIICYDNSRRAVCVPCGHIAMCMDCARRVKITTRVCPVCRSKVSDIIKIFNV